MQNKQKIIYYHDELNDEFSTAKITPKKIDDNYCYDDSGRRKKFARFVWYKVIARPLAYVFLKVRFHHKIVNKEILKSASATGYFLYGNHTNPVADALIPSMAAYPTDVYVIVHPNNVSMPVLGSITPSLGALPLPDTIGAAKNFTKTVKAKIAQQKCVMIYPEAHIWPYYTKIRPFEDTSFRYPVQSQTPVFCLTNTYRKRRFSKVPQIVTYIDGPFYPQEGKTAKQQKALLREQVYNAMTERSTNNTVELIKYVKQTLDGGTDD